MKNLESGRLLRILFISSVMISVTLLKIVPSFSEGVSYYTMLSSSFRDLDLISFRRCSNFVNTIIGGVCIIFNCGIKLWKCFFSQNPTPVKWIKITGIILSQFFSMQFLTSVPMIPSSIPGISTILIRSLIKRNLWESTSSCFMVVIYSRNL